MGLLSGIAGAAGGTVAGAVVVGGGLAATAAIGSALSTVVTMLGQEVMEHFKQGDGNLGFQEVFRPMIAGGLTLAVGAGCLGALFGLIGGLITGCSSERNREDSCV